MANILRRNNEGTNAAVAASSFIDRTGEGWYCKDDTKKIVFCKSIDDIIEGKAESFDFVKRENSVRYDKNAKNEDVERKKYALFTLANNDKILVRLRGQIK
jgi:hypothetical protein